MYRTLLFPDQVQVLPAHEEKTQTPDGRITTLNIAPPEEQPNSAIEKFKSSEKPAIIAGHGARFNMEAIIQLAEKLNCQVMTTFKGKV